jgi:hypothetical protein
MTFDAADISAATQALCLASLEGTEIDTDVSNFVSAYDYALSRDTPTKLWWHSDARHPAIARALKIDRAETVATYAIAPFRLGTIDEKPCILAALPCPHFFAPADIDWLRIETVIAWDPVADTATVIGDDAPQLAGKLCRFAETATIYASPFAFFRAICEERAQFAINRSMIASNWTRKPVEPNVTPGLLLIGDIGHVRWPSTLPETLHLQGLDTSAVNRAILRSARLPRAVGQANLARAA